jgi:hypothetical protein
MRTEEMNNQDKNVKKEWDAPQIEELGIDNTEKNPGTLEGASGVYGIS